MLRTLQNVLSSPGTRSLARAYSRLGRIGFWMQIAIGSIPVALFVYGFIVDRSSRGGTRGGFALIDYLTLASLLILAFTTIWFYRYTRLAKRISNPERRPPELALQRATWIGVAASTLGIVFSMLVMLFELTQLLLYFLRTPQAGIPVVQTTAGGAASWVSAADIVSLLALILTMFVEFAVLAFSLWLLFRTTVASIEYPRAALEMRSQPRDTLESSKT
jgi:hypothetical protein